VLALMLYKLQILTDWPHATRCRRGHVLTGKLTTALLLLLLSRSSHQCVRACF